VLSSTGPTNLHTRIVCTLGPISETSDCIEALVAAGMDVVRLSMSNGTRERHLATVRLVRAAAADQGRQVRFLADLQGRKNRLGRLPGGQTEWLPGAEVVLTAEPGTLASHRTWITYPWHPDLVVEGMEIPIDDGAVTLRVKQAHRDELRCVVVEGGTIADGRGITIPALAMPAVLTERDAEDLDFALRLGVDMVALSFASSADDYRDVRSVAPDQLIIGKVESATAVARLPELASAFDGLMVARGDLGLEIPFEDVPFVQRAIIAECASQGKLSIVATQVLLSMRTRLRPTRAEVADVVTAVLDGAGGLMLTGETGYGRHPVHVVNVLRRIVERAEQHAPIPSARASMKEEDAASTKQEDEGRNRHAVRLRTG
jgi:pyruvate kinase